MTYKLTTCYKKIKLLFSVTTVHTFILAEDQPFKQNTPDTALRIMYIHTV